LDSAAATNFEELLISEGAVQATQLERARRISQRLSRPRDPVELLIDLGQMTRSEYERILRLHRSQLGLIQILCEDGALDEARAAACEQTRLERPELTDRDLLVSSGYVPEDQFLRAVSVKHDIPLLAPEVQLIDPAVIGRASMPYLLKNLVLPLREAEGHLVAIFADPLDLEVRGEIERIFGLPVRACAATSEKIVEALHTYERLRDGKTHVPESSLQYRELREALPSDVSGEGAVAIVDYLMLRAVQMGASDLHIEPQGKRVRVRIRVDGVLQVLTDLPSGFAAQVTSRVKVLAGIDIAERRLHQDGRISVRVNGREVDIRVSCYVSTEGETLVLRLLDRQRGLVALEQLGLGPHELVALRDTLLRTSSGLVLITGPTGSGKTTTLYSCIDFLSRPDVKVITCEDPVEYMLEGVVQCSVNSATGPTFVDSLRAIVRQDPDVIVVGEIRDNETAALAIEASLTGHKVFSTFHTEDAVGAVVRIKEMKVQPYLVASTLAGVIAQRLLRRNCTQCSVPAEPSREDLRFLGLPRTELSGVPLMAGAGCAACGGTGYRGRLGVYELMLPDDDLRDAILLQTPSRELRRLARRLPVFMTLQESGLLKAAAGQTTLSEVAANAPRDVEPRPLSLLRNIAGGTPK
jgi:type IV pilus assembly protein PilB